MSSDHDNRGKFKAGNKAGTKSKRNKEIVAYIREISNDLQDYVDMIDVAIRDPKTKLGDKISCIKEMLDRSMGKSAISVHQTGDLSIVIGLPEDLDV